MQVNREALVAELKGLRKGEGCTPDRLAQSPAIRQAIGDAEFSTFASLVLGTAEHDLEVGKQREGQNLTALAHALNLVSRNAPKKLMARRNDYALEIGKHVTTVEQYELAGIELLADGLIDWKSPDRTKIAVLMAHVDSGKYSSIQMLNGLYRDPESPLQDIQTSRAIIPGKGEGSLPWLLHRTDNSHDVVDFSMSVTFVNLLPKQVYAMHADTTTELMIAPKERLFKLDLREAFVNQSGKREVTYDIHFGRPESFRYYMAFWHF